MMAPDNPLIRHPLFGASSGFSSSGFLLARRLHQHPPPGTARWCPQALPVVFDEPLDALRTGYRCCYGPEAKPKSSVAGVEAVPHLFESDWRVVVRRLVRRVDKARLADGYYSVFAGS